jgi:hypothetical protein
MIMRAMEHSIPWPRMQQLLNELLVALASFDCRRALALLTESVAEYRTVHAISDYVWTRKAIAPTADGAKVADFAAKKRHSDAAVAKPSQQHPT